MIDFFVLDGDEIRPSIDLLAMSEFDALWHRDKDQALKEFKYIYFASWYKSATVGMSEAEREAEAAKIVFGKTYKPDKLVKDAIRRIMDYQEKCLPTLRLYMAAKEAVYKLEQFFKTVDLTETNDKGTLLYPIGQVTKAISEVGNLSKSMRSLYETVALEGEQSQTKAGRATNEFEK